MIGKLKDIWTEMDSVHTKLNGAADMIFTLRDALESGVHTSEDYVGAATGIFAYMVSLLEELGDQIEVAAKLTNAIA